MPKDHESILPENIPLDGPTDVSGPQPFTPDQMVTCEKCLRANPPTRSNCLYCGIALPLTEATIDQQKPTLRALDKWERGYNTILLPPPANLTDAELAEAADVLRLTPAELGRILASEIPLPLARTPTAEDAAIIQRRLGRLQINTTMIADEDLGVDETQVIKVRKARIDDESFRTYQTPQSPAIELPWSNLTLMVAGRLTRKRIELREQKSGRAEDRILDSSEFFADEVVIDLYGEKPTTSYRIAASGFDFSCLGRGKSLVAGENIKKLISLIRERAPGISFDESYNSLLKTIEPVWPADRHNQSQGLHRGRPGKITVGTATETSNEMQFRRYSRLRSYFLLQPKGS